MSPSHLNDWPNRILFYSPALHQENQNLISLIYIYIKSLYACRELITYCITNKLKDPIMYRQSFYSHKCKRRKLSLFSTHVYSYVVTWMHRSGTHFKCSCKWKTQHTDKYLHSQFPFHMLVRSHSVHAACSDVNHMTFVWCMHQQA